MKFELEKENSKSSDFFSLLGCSLTKFVIFRSFFTTYLLKKYAFTGFGDGKHKKVCEMYFAMPYAPLNVKCLERMVTSHYCHRHFLPKNGETSQ